MLPNAYVRNGWKADVRIKDREVNDYTRPHNRTSPFDIRTARIVASIRVSHRQENCALPHSQTPTVLLHIVGECPPPGRHPSSDAGLNARGSLRSRSDSNR